MLKPRIAIAGILDGRDWKLDLAQRDKLESLAQENAESGLVGQLDIFSSGESADSLQSRGEFQQAHPWLATIRSGFRVGPDSAKVEGSDRVFRSEVLRLMGRAEANPISERVTFSGTVSSHEIDQTKPSAQRLREQVLENMKQYPNSRQVVLLSGHFEPKSEKLAGLDTRDISRALSALPTSITTLISDGCYFGDVEQLAQLPPQVETAVVSQRATSLKEQLVLKNGVKAARLIPGLDLNNALEPTNTTAELARQVVTSGTGHSGVAYSAVDMNNFRRELIPQLKSLAANLTPEDKSIFASQARVAKDVPKVDLGHFLRDLSRSGSAAVKPLAESTYKALEATIIARSVSQEHPQDTGLNVGWEFLEASD